MARQRDARASKPPYLDKTLDADRRASDLLGRMTLEEKVRQMSMVARFGDLLAKKKVSVAAMRRRYGKISPGCIDDPRLGPEATAEAVNAVQRYLVEQTRLGIPAIVTGECLHGHMSGGTTVFPQAIGLASTWDVDLIAEMGSVIAKEARVCGVSQALAPDLDLARDPRWGRVEETYGEDPYLVSRMGVAYINGMQGNGPTIDRKHVACMAKHYAAHGSPEAGVNCGPVAGGMRDLYMHYLPPFEAAVKEACVSAIMNAYSEYEGVPAAASKLLLTTILREQWGFPGWVFSDYCSIEMLHSFHRTAATPGEAGRQAVEAGLDLEAPSEFGFGDRLLELVREGRLAEELIDRSVSRILRAKFLLGLFESPYADTKAVGRTVHRPEYRRLARRIAEESVILLKNDGGVLPLSPDIGSIAVIGPNADLAQLGDYTVPEARGVTPLRGIRRAVSKGTTVRFAPGCSMIGYSEEGFAEAVEAASSSDAAVVVVGGTSNFYGGVGWGADQGAATCGEGFDMSDLNLMGVQEKLVRAVHETGTPTVLVLMHGRPNSITALARDIPAIVEAWYPGEEGGHALADVLFGNVNPSGRLPISVPRSVGHVPACYNHAPSARGVYGKPGTPESPGRDYVFSDTRPLFAFGHGLSYTSFRYTRLRVSPKSIRPDGRAEVKVNVRNTGARAGREVVQLYVNDLYSSMTTPVKSLRGFRKISLQPGEQQTVTFDLRPEDLAMLDANQQWIVEPGDFEITVGLLSTRLTVSGEPDTA